MVFTSHIFLFYFLPLVLLLNYVLPFRWLTLMLAIVSYGFYGWTNPKWLLLLFTSSFVDYWCGLALIHLSGLPRDRGELPALPKGGLRNPKQKLTLGISMVTNLTILGIFKYYDFGVENLNALLHSVGAADRSIQLLHVALPIGISFYTFQSMSYAIDIYRGEARPLRNPVDFACFVALFPHQLAGPIIRYWSIAEQFRHRTFTPAKFARGIAFFSLGMSKKILLANPMARMADGAFAANTLHTTDAWTGVVAYAFQIYFDFSGYSDMAVGMGLMLGFYFTKNFDSPYQASSITDFWRRWHMSLSTWLRDYLYLPLGGNRRGATRTYVNLMTVMLLGGLWHGASWNFVAWGGLHGGLLAFERAQGRHGLYHRLPHVIKVAVTFFIVCIAWVFFRSDTMSRSLHVLAALAGFGASEPGAAIVAPAMYSPYHLMTLAICAVVVWTAPQSWHFSRQLTPLRAATCLGLFGVSILMLWTQTSNPFLYFQF